MHRVQTAPERRAAFPEEAERLKARLRDAVAASPALAKAIDRAVALVNGAPGVPESFKVLMKEMQALCINVEVLADDGSEIEMRDLDEDVFRAAEELGIDISRNERGTDEDDREREARRAARTSGY